MLPKGKMKFGWRSLRSLINQLDIASNEYYSRMATLKHDEILERAYKWKCAVRDYMIFGVFWNNQELAMHKRGELKCH